MEGTKEYYKVMVLINHSYDPFTAEYSGIEHDNILDAKRELHETTGNHSIMQAWIETITK